MDEQPNKIMRIVPNIYTDDMSISKQFYAGFLDMQIVMEKEWMITFASKNNSNAQINLLQNEDHVNRNNEAIFISIEVENVDQLFEQAKDSIFEIVYDIKDENWGVRRFFVKDPNGATINILSHIK